MKKQERQGYRHAAFTEFLNSSVIKPVQLTLTNMQTGMKQDVTYWFEDLNHYCCTCENGAVINLYHKMTWRREPSRSEM